MGVVVENLTFNLLVITGNIGSKIVERKSDLKIDEKCLKFDQKMPHFTHFFRKKTPSKLMIFFMSKIYYNDGCDETSNPLDLSSENK